MRRRLFPRRVPHVRGAPGAKSFVDDLILGRGFVRSRAAPSLRSIESQPSTQAFVAPSAPPPAPRRGPGPGRPPGGGEGRSGPASPRRAVREGFAPASLILSFLPLRPPPPPPLPFREGSGLTWRLRPVGSAAPLSLPSPRPPPPPPPIGAGATGRPDAVREGGGTAPPREASDKDAAGGAPVPRPPTGTCRPDRGFRGQIGLALACPASLEAAQSSRSPRGGEAPCRRTGPRAADSRCPREPASPSRSASPKPTPSPIRPGRGADRRGRRGSARPPAFAPRTGPARGKKRWRRARARRSAPSLPPSLPPSRAI
nr:transcription initiation factor TFIID subunit 4-like isoform X2 [Anas platyrhynchos]